MFLLKQIVKYAKAENEDHKKKVDAKNSLENYAYNSVTHAVPTVPSHLTH